MNRFRCSLFLMLVLSHSVAFAQEHMKWDDKMLGIKVRKPDKGRRWIVQETLEDTEGSALQSGDEIWEIDDKTVTVDDDLLAILAASGDTVKIKAKRATVNPKTNRPGRLVTGEKTFSKTFYWDYVRAKFTVDIDALTKNETWTDTAGKEALRGETSFVPSLVMIDNEPKHVRMLFKYHGKDWLFIKKITFRHGDKEWIIEKDFGEVKTEILSGGVLEWFIDVDGWTEEALQEVGKTPDAESIIRLHGKDYFHDHKLSNAERVTFSNTLLLMKIAKQRHADLAKNE